MTPRTRTLVGNPKTAREKMDVNKGEKEWEHVEINEDKSTKRILPASQHHGGPAQRGEGGPTEGPDCSTAARSPCRDARNGMAAGGCVKGLSPEQVIFLQQEIESRSQQIHR